MKRTSKSRSRHKDHALETPGTGTAGTGMSWDHERANPGKGMPFTNLLLIPGSLIPLSMSVWSSSMQVMQSSARSLTDLSLGAMRSWMGIVQNSSEILSGFAPRHAE